MHMLILTKKKKIVLLSAFVVAITTTLLFVMYQKDTPVISQSSTDITDTRCYGIRERVVDEYIYNLVRIDFYEDTHASAQLYYKDAEFESAGVLEGRYSRENNEIDGMYDFYTNSELFSEERRIRFNELGLVFGFGEMYQDDQGISRYENPSEIIYDYPLPMIACIRYDLWKDKYDATVDTTGIILTN